MKKWQFSAMVCKNLYASGFNMAIDGTQLWIRNKKGENKTEWDEVAVMGERGWELVSVTPLCGSSGWTTELLFAFKRPLE